MKLPPIVFAFAFAAVIAWRWRRLGWSVKLAGAVMSAAPALHGAGVFHPPELETVIGDLGSALGPYTYALVAVMAFLETGAFVGPLVPGETVVIAGGVVASQGHIDLVAVVGLTWICALRETSRVMPCVAGSPAVSARARASGSRHRAQSDPGGGVLRPLRARDDPNREIRRAWSGRSRRSWPGASRDTQPAGSPRSRSPAPACGALRSCSWASRSGNRSTRLSRSPSAARWLGACSSSWPVTAGCEAGRIDGPADHGPVTARPMLRNPRLARPDDAPPPPNRTAPGWQTASCAQRA